MLYVVVVISSSTILCPADNACQKGKLCFFFEIYIYIIFMGKYLHAFWNIKPILVVSY